MSLLESITTKSKTKANLIILYGPGGVGKTTLGTQARAPLFIPFENGLIAHDGVARTPKPQTVAHLLEMIRELGETEHDYRTLVIDSLDWLEPIVWADVCAENGVTDIEGFGYGKGYVKALQVWQRIFNGLKWLRDTKGMNIFLICHEEVQQVTDPVHGDHLRSTLKLHKKAAALAREACDIIAYCAVEHNMITGKDGAMRAVKGDHVMYLTAAPGHAAKCRYAGMPDKLPLSWPAFTQAFISATTQPTAEPTPDEKGN